MSQRIAITVAGVVATSALAVGLVAAGFGPRSATQAPKEAAAVADPALETATSTGGAPDVETVYVKPAPPPRTIVVRRQVPARSGVSSSTSRRTREVHHDGDDDDDRHERRERENEDDHGEREDDD